MEYPRILTSRSGSGIPILCKQYRIAVFESTKLSDICFGVSTITSCSNKGNVNTFKGGGISGINTGQAINDINFDPIPNSSLVTISKCYNSGNITGAQSGGICGNDSAENGGKIIIDQCYNLGVVNADWAAGIIGSEVGVNGGQVTISNSYNNAPVLGTSGGGIYSYLGPTVNPPKDNGPFIISNVYSINTGTGSSFSRETSTNNLTITNDYSAKIWNDFDAADELVDGPNYSNTPPKLEGTVWTDISPTTDDTPWQLTNNLQPKV